jgi:hypothetical protein
MAPCQGAKTLKPSFQVEVDKERHVGETGTDQLPGIPRVAVLTPFLLVPGFAFWCQLDNTTGLPRQAGCLLSDPLSRPPPSRRLMITSHPWGQQTMR